MKKVKKVIKCDSNMVCYTRSQRIRGYIAFVGLLACGVMIGWGFGSEPAKKISSGNDDVLILSSDKIDLTDTKVGQNRELPIKITAKKPIWIKDVRREDYSNYFFRWDCEDAGRIDSEHGCMLEVSFVPFEESAVETGYVTIRWEDENNNSGKSVVEVNYSAKGYTEGAKDCIEKEKAMLKALPADADYNVLAMAYRELSNYCYSYMSRYYSDVADRMANTAQFLKHVRYLLENKQ